MPKSTCANPECAEAPAPAKATGPRSSYCSARCKRRADYLRRREDTLAAKRVASAAGRTEKTCPQCDARFTPRKTTKQRFCSLQCGTNFANATWRASRGVCAEDRCRNRAVARGLCRQHHPSAGTWSAGDPETRRANLRRKTQQRRARLKGDAGAELIDRDQIGERDGWRCGLCSQPVDRALAYPHPQSASLDHVKPLSLGGKHVVANVQISHLSCNVAKGNRVDAQLLTG